MSFDEHHALLVISKPSANQLFPGFGVLKVHINNYRLQYLLLIPGHFLIAESHNLAVKKRQALSMGSQY